MAAECEDGFLITLDIDWAPDFVIEVAAERLIEAGVKATWMVTHRSAAVERLRDHPDLFELGIHPNFNPGSTHGSTVEEVLHHCMELVPDARCMRTHGLVQSTAILDAVMRLTPIQVDLSLYYPAQELVEGFRYRWEGRSIFRIPFLWEDDLAMQDTEPQWCPEQYFLVRGARVFNFHPIHLYLNQPRTRVYSEMLRGIDDLKAVCADDLQPFRNDGDGPQRFFNRLLERNGKEGRSQKVHDWINDFFIERG